MKLLILDGNSIANKAFYGVRGLNAPDGTPTNAIQGFLNIFLKIYSQIKPDAVCASFDLKAPTFRHNFAQYYKANRHPMPDDLAIQMPLLKNILDDMGINRYEIEGYEADDVLGTIGAVCEDEGWNCYIATGDRDSFQLITDKVNICYLGKDTVIYNKEVFAENFGFEPINLIDYKAIAGDSSDNYPGVPGIGEKGAADLIKSYSTLDNVYAHIDELKAGTQNKLNDGKKSAYDSLYLATINKSVPIDFKPEDNLWNNSFKTGLYDDLKSLGFYKLIEKFKLVPESSQLSLFEMNDDKDIPDNIFLTDDLKNNIDNIPDGKTPFDTTIAQYLINPTVKEYSSDVSYNLLNSKLHELGLDDLYNNVELPLCGVLHKMEKKGFLVDRNALNEFKEEISSSIDVLQQSIYSRAGTEFNINSPKQLGSVLFDSLGLPNKKKGSTNIEVLEDLRFYHPIIDEIIDYRTYAKLKGTYCDGLLDVIADDGRIHTSFQQTVTATGRLSSTEPNLQNIPIRKQIGSKIRSMFIAPEGYVLVDADYSQIELRLLAHISGDEAMIDAFNSGYDFHTVTASNVFNVPVDQITPQLRARAKAVNFGIIYGMGPFSLAKDINVSTREAKEYIDAYFSKYKGVERYMHDVVENAEKDGYVKTVFGRRRPVPELASSNHNTREFGKRIALNMPIQGTAADIIKKAMVDVDSKIDGMVLQVHDELIVECPESKADDVALTLKESMENVVNLSLPLTVDIGIGHTWAEAH